MDPSKLCQSCEHWEAPIEPGFWGKCHRITDCVDPVNRDIVRSIRAMIPFRSVRGPDDKDCVPLHTIGDEFGCLLWEEQR